MRATITIAALLALAGIIAAAESAPIADQPGPEEVEVWALCNFQRMDRSRGDQRVRELLRQLRGDQNLGNFERTSRGAANVGPVVFNPLLQRAARSLLHDGAKPVAEQRPDAAGPMRAVGYLPAGEGQVLLAVDAPSPAAAYAAALAQIVGRRERPIYAASEAMRGAWREVGIAVANDRGRYALAMVLGTGSAKRHLGGVAFVDANHDGEYQAGEGRAATITVAGRTIAAGPSGAWWCATDEPGEAEVGCIADALRATLRSGKSDAILAWSMPDAADLAAADKLIAEAEKAPPADEARRRKAQVALIAGTRLAALDDARRQRIDRIAGPMRDEIDALASRCRAALAQEPADFRRTVAEMRKSWGGTLDPWFRQFEGLYDLRGRVNALLASPPAGQARGAAALDEALRKAIAGCGEPGFLEELRTLHGSIEHLLIASAPKRR